MFGTKIQLFFIYIPCIFYTTELKDIFTNYLNKIVSLSQITHLSFKFVYNLLIIKTL